MSQENNPSEIRIIFFGTPEFSAKTLESLVLNKYQISAVITQPDKITGRKKILSPSPVKMLAENLGIAVLSPLTLKDDSFFDQFKNLNPDICIVVAYGKIIPERYLTVPKYGFINIHPSLLPKHRGPSPIQSAILNGDKETGVSIMVVDKEMDHGPIIKIEKLKEDISNLYYPELRDKLSQLGNEMLIEILPKFISGDLKPEEQNHKDSTLCQKIEKEDAKINWHDPTFKIYNQIRALNPEPKTWTKFKDKILNITKAKIHDKVANERPGTVIKKDNQIIVATGDKFIEIETLQLEGKNPISAKNFSNGYKDFIGSILG